MPRIASTILRVPTGKVVTAELNQLGDDCVFSQQALDLDGRSFFVQVQRLDNGVFVSVSEGASKRIGSLAVSLVSQAGAVPVTTTIIPPRSQDSAFFIRMVAEQLSTRTSGIAVVSIYVKNELKISMSKVLLEAIVGMIQYENNGH